MKKLKSLITETQKDKRSFDELKLVKKQQLQKIVDKICKQNGADNSDFNVKDYVIIYIGSNNDAAIKLKNLIIREIRKLQNKTGEWEVTPLQKKLSLSGLQRHKDWYGDTLDLTTKNYV